MLALLDTLAVEDHTADGDFWRQQHYVDIPKVPRPHSYLDLISEASGCLHGKKIAVPKMYIGGDDPKAKPTVVSEDVIQLWQRARKDLEALGATVIETDFPLVTNYEDDSVTGHANNVVGFKSGWNGKERGELVAFLWDDFLRNSGDKNFSGGLATVDGTQMFPRPEGYIPDQFMEHKNFIDYPGLVELCKTRMGKSIWEIDGIEEALPALEAQRKRDLENWMDERQIDVVVFPANGDVGRADLEYNEESARHALQNGVKYSNGNRALRHMGVPTVSVTMGLMATSKMPLNLTFAGKHAQDSELLKYAYAFESATKHRSRPPVTPELDTDRFRNRVAREQAGDNSNGITLEVAPSLRGTSLTLEGRVNTTEKFEIGAYVDGQAVPFENIKISGGSFSIHTETVPFQPSKPLYGGVGRVVNNFNVVVLARCQGQIAGQLLMVPQAS